MFILMTSIDNNVNMYYIMFMLKSKALKITTLKKYFKANNEVLIHPRSMSKNMEVKRNVEMGLWLCLVLS